MAVASSYFIIFMYGSVPLAMYIAITVLMVFATMIILCTLASMPDSNTKVFKARWKWAPVSKWGRLKLSSLGSVGFAIGDFVTIVKASTTLTLADLFVNTIATVVLLG